MLPPSPDAHQPCTLGVLFVHGIGAQRRGETLSSFGGALVQWLQHAYRGLQLRFIANGATRERLDEWRLAAVEPRHAARGDLLVPELLRSVVASAPAAAGGAPDIAAVAQQLGATPVTTRVALEDVRLASGDDPEAPAHGILTFHTLHVDGSLEEGRWLLAESWWAETFSVPRFGELARWGLGVIPWTLGSHFGARVRAVWQERQEVRGAAAGAGWMLRWARALAGLLASVVLSLVALVLLVLMLPLAALPVPWLRDALGAIQRQIAASLGDSYVLVSRPVEAASIVGQVRRDLAWLARRCDVVAIVAHSQGAAVAYEAVRTAPPPRLRLLFTFGSGLRKLEELRYIVEHGRQFRRAAALTLTGLVFTQLLVVAIVSRWLSPDPPNLADATGLLVVGAEGVAGFALLVAGLRDFVRGARADTTHDVARSLDRLGVRWIDCHASADPVPNGPAFDSREGSSGTSIEVCNERSAFRDHTIYWRNLDDFVSRLVEALAMAAGRRLPGLAFEETWFSAVAARRRWRVRTLVLMRAIAAASAIAGFMRYRDAWAALLAWSLIHSVRLFAGLVGIGDAALPSPPAAAPDAATLGRSAGLLAVVLSAYAIARVLWGRLDDADMVSAVRRYEVDDPSHWTAVALVFQAVVGVSIALGSADYAPWVFAIGTATAGVLTAVTRPRFPRAYRATPPVADGPRYTEQTTAWLRRLLSAGSLIVVLFIAARAAWGWMQSAAAPSPIMLAAISAVVLLAGGAIIVRRGRRNGT